MQKMTLSIKLSIWKYFSKILTRNVDHYEGFWQSFTMIGPFTAIPSICNQRSLLYSNKISKRGYSLLLSRHKSRENYNYLFTAKQCQSTAWLYKIKYCTCSVPAPFPHGTYPSSIYSWSIKLLILFHSGFKSRVVKVS